MSETTPEPDLFNMVALAGGLGSTYALACRACGALVPSDPLAYKEQHLKWHAQLLGLKP